MLTGPAVTPRPTVVTLRQVTLIYILCVSVLLKVNILRVILIIIMRGQEVMTLEHVLTAVTCHLVISLLSGLFGRVGGSNNVHLTIPLVIVFQGRSLQVFFVVSVLLQIVYHHSPLVQLTFCITPPGNR